MAKTFVLSDMTDAEVSARVVNMESAAARRDIIMSQIDALKLQLSAIEAYRATESAAIAAKVVFTEVDVIEEVDKKTNVITTKLADTGEVVAVRMGAKLKAVKADVVIDEVLIP